MLEVWEVTFHLYGFVIAIAIVVGVWVTAKIVQQQKIPVDIENTAIIVVLSGIFGARVYHVITDWQLYADQPWEVFFIWQGGLGVIGAVIGGIIGLSGYVYWNDLRRYFFSILDSVIISIPLVQSIGRWGNFFNQELFGPPTSLPWGIFIELDYRPVQFANFERFHPLFLYESIMCLLLFLILFFFYKKEIWKIGQTKFLAVYLIGYSMIRWSLEFLRIETARSQVLSFFSIAQWVMIGVFCLGWYLFFHPRKKYE